MDAHRSRRRAGGVTGTGHRASTDPARFPPSDSMPGAPFPSPGSRRLGSPGSSVLRGTPTPCRPSRRVWFPSLGGTALHHLFAPLPPGAGWAGPGTFGSGPPVWTVDLRGDGSSGPPRFLGDPPCMRAPVLRPRRGRDARPLQRPRCGLPLVETRRPPRCRRFRGSIAGPTCSLSTLRSPGRPGTTQDSLPAAGRHYRTGLATRRDPCPKFQPMSGFLLGQACPGAPDPTPTRCPPAPARTGVRDAVPSQRRRPRRRGGLGGQERGLPRS